MKIQRVVCDRCKKDIYENDRRFEITVEGGLKTWFYDLCPKCLQDFDLFVDRDTNADKFLKRYDLKSKVI